MIREEGGVLKPSKIRTRTRRNFKFGNNVHNYLKNHEMLSILKYFSFLCQLKSHKARNELVTKDFDLKFGYRNGFLAGPKIQKPCVCVHFLNSKLCAEKLIFIPLTFDLDIFPNMSIREISHKMIYFLRCVEALHQISASQVKHKWKAKGFYE